MGPGKQQSRHHKNPYLVKTLTILIRPDVSRFPCSSFFVYKTSISTVICFLIWNYCVWIYCSCSVNWESKMANNRSFILYMFAFGLFVPLVVIVVSYFSILRVVKKVNRPASAIIDRKIIVYCVTKGLFSSRRIRWVLRSAGVNVVVSRYIRI